MAPPLRQNPLHLLRIYFQAAKYCCVFPVEIKCTSNPSSHSIRSCSKKRKLMCAIIVFSCCFLETTRFLRYLKFNKPTDLNPVSYFELARYLTSVFYPIITFSIIWLKFAQLQKALDLLQMKFPNGLANYYSSVSVKKQSFFITFLFIAIFCFNFYAFTIDTLFSKHGFSNLTQTFHTWREIFYKQFFLDILYPNARDHFKNCIGILAIFMMCLSVLAYIFLDCLPLIFTFVLKTEVNECTKMMADSLANKTQQNKITFREVEQIVLRYQTTLKFSNAINEVFGIAVFCFSLTWIPYFIFVFLGFLNPSGVISFLRQLYRLGAYFGFLSIAALINSRCEDIDDWLNNPEIYSKLSFRQLQTLLQEASGRKIGISGGRWFKISNGFLGSIVTSFLTFAVIILQFKYTNQQQQQQCDKIT